VAARGSGVVCARARAPMAAATTPTMQTSRARVIVGAALYPGRRGPAK